MKEGPFLLVPFLNPPWIKRRGVEGLEWYKIQLERGNFNMPFPFPLPNCRQKWDFFVIGQKWLIRGFATRAAVFFQQMTKALIDPTASLSWQKN